MKRFFATIALLLASALAVQAQSASGILFNRDIVSASSLLALSQRESQGTARSIGMGGAFTSLGADMASFGYNPAGFGMYQRNEISFTVGINSAIARNYNAYNTTGNTSVRCIIDNIGASFKVYEGSGNLVAVNFAFGYNKTADYNYDIAYEGPATVSSLADAFADIANANGLIINSDNKIADANGYYDYDMNSYFWGPALAYKAGLINRGADGWYPDEIGAGAEMSQYTDLASRGSAGEFSFAFGFNINNFLYLGASLDIQTISRKQTIYYSEYIDYPNGQPSGTDMPYQLQYFKYGQSMAQSGTGVGAKFGVVLRPIEALRIGFAVHTPSYYSMSYRYQASLGSIARSAGSDPNGWAESDGYVYATEDTPTMQDGGSYRWKFTTPTRLLAGISYAIGPFAVISADYQYDAYRALKLNYAPVDTGYTSDTFKGELKGTHTIRAGIEAKPLPWLSLRVGGGWKSSVMGSDYNIVAFSEPVADRYWYASAGLGFRISDVTSIDLAYRYRNTCYTDYYSYRTINNIGTNASPLYGLDIINHDVALTFAFRF